MGGAQAFGDHTRSQLSTGLAVKVGRRLARANVKTALRTHLFPGESWIGKPFLFLARAVPFLIVLAGLAIQPAVQAQPVVSTIAVTSPGWVAGMVADPIRSRVYVDGNFLYVPVARQFSQATGKQTILPASEKPSGPDQYKNQKDRANFHGGTGAHTSYRGSERCLRLLLEPCRRHCHGV